MVDSMPVRGDIIFADRGLYKHYGIYAGKARVIHFSTPDGCEIDGGRADVFEVSLKEFANGDKVSIIREKENSEYKALPADDIIQRARSKIGKSKGTYSLVSNNCEHFAYWCRYGKAESRQVENVAAVVTAIGFLPLILLNAISFFINGDEDFEDAINKKFNSIDSIGMKDVILYFKDPGRLQKLKENSNFIAVCTKENCSNGVYKIVCCIFDKSANDIVNPGDIVFLQSKKLESDLTEAFGDKDMIVLL